MLTGQAAGLVSPAGAEYYRIRHLNADRTVVREVQINDIPVHENADRQTVGYAALHPPYIFGYLNFL